MKGGLVQNMRHEKGNPMEIICILDSGSTETGTKQEHGDALITRKKFI
jgi:hypothetical protein